MKVKSTEEAINHGSLPPQYYSNPVVQQGMEAGCVVVPLALFVDGAEYSETDSCVVMTVSPILGNFPKQVFAVVRKKLMACNCVCRGKCQLHGIYSVLLWSLRALARNLHPMQSHTGLAFSDLVWQDVAGQPLFAANIRFAVTQLRCDWGEMASLGLPAPTSRQHACPLCHAKRETMHVDLNEHCISDQIWPKTTFEEYCAACTACEYVLPVLTGDTLTAFQQAVKPDFRDKGPKGLALRQAIPELGLQKNDRLEPSLQYPNVLAVYEEPPPPGSIMWRTSSESMARCRSALFAGDLGLTMEHAFCVDGMHTLCLGLYPQLVAHVLWACLKTHVDVRERKLALSRVSSKLRQFYHVHRSNKTLSKVLLPLSEKKLGTIASPQLKAKASECLWLLRWLCDKTWGVASWEDPLELKDLWTKACTLLEETWSICQGQPFVMSAASIEVCTRI
eukprot:6458378-Amphidinium_carterae.2